MTFDSLSSIDIDERTKNAWCRVVSVIFSPLLVPNYGILLAVHSTFLIYSALAARVIVTAATFLATCVLPVLFIFILWKLKAVREPQLRRRQDRTWPYALSALCYFGTAYYYYCVNAPAWLSMFMVGGGAALIVQLVVNLRWKISAHAAAQGGLIALVYYLMCSGNTVESMQWLLIVTVLITGLVCSCRLRLERHSLLQILAGLVNGFVCTFCAAWFF